ncbi:hypothetical protein HNO88_003596 [Novosphingobium chloroacetimidivorans]|uniref:Sulfotransferase family protein n=1 Tax=Novosphingobium chloroacetimidivorans TaxID=1428314 RepID=A0A7W7NYA1_9SPHN|nr:hypothetical protein [Novosphingobium chloroacetimidivorans]MBB4860254.1 hypothetical protein [Novosphingobium chloroacetimidivorans]
MTLSSTTAPLLADATWLAHRYDPGHDAVHFVRVPREAHRTATFLTDEHLPPGLEPLVVRRADAMAMVPRTAPLHFVFHSAYCCSTLLARAFDRPDWAMGLKEPVIFNDLVGWKRRGGQGPDMASVLDDALTLLARPFTPGEAVIVKPSNIASVIAAPILALRPQSRAVLLYAPLRTYLASIAKKGLDGRLWVRTLLLGLLDDRLIDMGFSPRDHLGHSDLQVAAVGWLAQQALFARLVSQFGDTRVRTLSSADLMRDPAAAMTRLAALFGLPLQPGEAARMVAGPAFTRHSKSDTQFAASEREAEHSAAAQTHGDEIDKVAQWAEAVAQAAGIALVPPAPLLDGSQA